MDNPIRKQQTSTISAELLSAMLEDARQKIFILRDETKTKNLIQRFMNQVIVYENEIQVSLNLILNTNGGGGAFHVVCRSCLKVAKELQIR